MRSVQKAIVRLWCRVVVGFVDVRLSMTSIGGSRGIWRVAGAVPSGRVCEESRSNRDQEDAMLRSVFGYATSCWEGCNASV